MKKINIHIYPSDLKNAARILKETKTIKNLGFFDEIILIGIWKKGLPEYEMLDENRKIWRVKTSNKGSKHSSLMKLFFFVEFQLKIFSKFKKENIFMVNPHCLAVLPLSFLMKKRSKSILVYDTHELETQRPTWSKMLSLLGMSTERILIRSVDLVVVVNKSIGDWYRKKYAIRNISVARNIPNKMTVEASCEKNFRHIFNIPANAMVFVFQGILVPGRYINLLLDVFAELEGNKHIVFMGRGLLKDKIVTYSEKYNNIHYHSLVPPDEVIQYVSSADMGFSLIKNSAKSNLYTLPNKLFECLLSGIPVVVNDLPEMVKIVNHYKAGVVMEVVNKEALINAIININSDLLGMLKKNVVNNCKNVCWETEEQNLIESYACLLKI